MRGIARGVLVSYLMQIIAPIVHASEIDASKTQRDNPKFQSPQTFSGWQSIATSSQHDKEKATQLLTQFHQSPTEQTPFSIQSKQYQYRLRIKALDSSLQKHQIKLSRKTKGSTDGFERLHTSTLSKGKLTTSSSENSDDALLQLFKAGAVGQYLDGGVNHCFAWQIAGVGTININTDGSVSINQDEQAPLLSSYDFILKTSNDLFIQSLQVASLSLASPKMTQQGHTTRILRSVSADSFYTDHDVRNLGQLDVHHTISGPGKLTNHGMMNLKGTTDNHAILGIHDFENKKLDGYLDPIFNAEHLKLTKDNHYFVNDEQCKVHVKGSFVADSSTASTLTNQGSMILCKVSLNREAANTGFWQAHQMDVCSAPFTNKHHLKVLDSLTVHSHLHNVGELNVNKLLRLKSGLNKGKISGDNIKIDIDESMINEGISTFHELVGSGKFLNKGQLHLKGSEQKPTKIGIKIFEHGDDSAKDVKKARMLPEKLKDDRPYIFVMPTNEQFTIHKGVEMPVRKLHFIPPAHTLTSQPQITRTFINRGALQGDDIEIYRSRTVNEGTMRILKFGIHGWEFENAIGAQLHVEQDTTMNVDKYLNNGEMITHGKFATRRSFLPPLVQQEWSGQSAAPIKTSTSGNSCEVFEESKSQFNNTGFWRHYGDIDLGTTDVTNHGTITWQKGTLSTKTQSLNNHGNWIFDEITSIQPISLNNHGTLKFHSSSLTFSSLINTRDLIFISGQYIVLDEFQNNRLMSFPDNDWVFTDDKASNARNRFIVKDYGSRVFSSGEIESSHSLTYDVKSLPKVIRAAGNLTFTQRHQSHRTLDDLLKVQANGKVSYYCPGTITTRGYNLSGINHLDLYVHGSLRILHEIKAPKLTLDVSWGLVVGESNDKMGTLAATDDALEITAHIVDARFGMIYGKGPTRIKTTNGRIEIGNPKTGTDQALKAQYFSGCVLSDELVSLRNESYVASGSSLLLDSFADIFINFGKLASVSSLTLRSPIEVHNLGGLVHSQNSLSIHSPLYKHARMDRVQKNWLNIPCAGYSDQWRQIPGSGPAVLEALGPIHLYVQKALNTASDIRSAGEITFHKYSPNLSEPIYEEQIIKLYHGAYSCGGHGYHGWIPWVETGSLPCILQSATALSLNLGSFRIMGKRHGPVVVIHSTGAGYIGSSGVEDNAGIPAQTRLLNVTQFIEGQSSSRGLLKKDSDGTLVPVVPMGKTAVYSPAGLMQLESQQLPRQFKHVINPLERLPLGMYNMFIQEILGRYTHKNYVRGAKGEQLFSKLWNRNRQLSERTGKEIIARDSLFDIQDALLIHQLQLIEDKPFQITFLAVPPHEFTDRDGDVIDIQSKGELTIEDAKIVGKHWVNIFSEDQLRILSAKHVLTLSNGFQEYVNPSTIECEEGPLTVIGKKGFTMTAAKLRSLLRLMVGSTEGNTVIQDVLLKREEHHRHVEEGGLFEGDTVIETTQTSHTAESSEVLSKAHDVHVLSGQGHKTTITGSLLNAAAKIIFEGKIVETHASVGIDTSTTHATTEGPFSSSESTSIQQSATFNPTKIIAKEVHAKTQEARYYGTDFIADLIFDNTKDGASFGPTTTWLEYFQQTISESPLLKSDVGIKGGYEVMRPCHLLINKIIRDIEHGQIKFDSVVWDKNRTEIIGKLAETTYQLKSWHTDWAIHEQAIPDEALVVVALGITIATQGWGAGYAAETLGLGATASGMFGAGVASVCAQVGTSFLRTGDPLNAVASLFTDQYLRSLGTTLVTGGLAGTGSGNLQGFIQRLMDNAVKSVVRACVSSAIEKRDIGEALKGAGINTLIDSISGAIAEKIGSSTKDKISPLSAVENKLAHFVLGCGMGTALGAAAGHKDVLVDALTSGAGAVIGECVAEALADRQKLLKEARRETYEAKGEFDEEYFKSVYRSKLQPYINIGRLVAGAVIAATGRDPTLAIAAATNALQNNFAGQDFAYEYDGQSEEFAIAAKEAIIEVMDDIRQNPQAYAEEAAIAATPYADIVRRVANGEQVSAIEFGIETGLTFLPIGKIVKVGAKTGGKIAGKFAAAVAKKLETQKLLKAHGTPNAGGTITSFVTKQEEVYYRVYSGRDSGHFLTKVRPSNSLLAQEGLALPPSNTAQFIQEVIVPAGIRLQRSRALPAFGKRGGMEQFEILEEELAKVIFKKGTPF